MNGKSLLRHIITAVGVIAFIVPINGLEDFLEENFDVILSAFAIIMGVLATVHQFDEAVKHVEDVQGQRKYKESEFVKPIIK